MDSSGIMRMSIPGRRGHRPERKKKTDQELRLQKLEAQNALLLNKLNHLDAATLGTPTAPASLSDANEADKKKSEDTEFVVGENLDMKARWDHGLWVETADRAFRVHVGGRAQYDMVWMTAPDSVMFGPGGTGPIDDGFNFRRGRISVDGTFYEVIDFVTEWDFINTANLDPTLPGTQGNVANTPVPTDVWAQITHLPWIGNVRIGNQKPPISFEHLTSSRFLNFLERSLSFDAFIGGLDNGFRPGVQMYNWSEDERMTWALGVFKTNQNIFGWNTGDGEYDVTSRLTWLPVYEHDGRCLIHLGLGVSHQDVDENIYRYRARTEVRNGPGALHTPLLDSRLGVDSRSLLVPEFAMVWGPFSMAAEYYANWNTGTTFPVGGGAVPINRGTTYYQGAYVEALYFLTGEHRPYNLHGGSGAAFGRVIPLRPFYFMEGTHGNLFSSGAWQVGARYNWIDLQDIDLGPGSAHDITLGLNWFLNPNMKIQWNYSAGYRDVAGTGSDGCVHGFGTRLAMDF
jgi:phosphate-selective porin OprO/OprP